VGAVKLNSLTRISNAVGIDGVTEGGSPTDLPELSDLRFIRYLHGHVERVARNIRARLSACHWPDGRSAVARWCGSAGA
jgi:hypothetical protein